MFCNNCGKRIQDENNLCKECQSKYEKSIANSNTVAYEDIKTKDEEIFKKNTESKDNIITATPQLETIEDNEKNYLRKAKIIRLAKIADILLMILICIYIGNSDGANQGGGDYLGFIIIPFFLGILGLIYFIDLINKVNRKKRKAVSIIYSFIMFLINVPFIGMVFYILQNMLFK